MDSKANECNAAEQTTFGDKSSTKLPAHTNTLEQNSTGTAVAQRNAHL